MTPPVSQELCDAKMDSQANALLDIRESIRDLSKKIDDVRELIRSDTGAIYNRMREIEQEANKRESKWVQWLVGAGATTIGFLIAFTANHFLGN